MAKKPIEVETLTHDATRKNIPTADRCWHFAFSPDDSKIVVACGRSNNVLVFDANTYERLKELPLKDMPWGVVTYPKSMGSLDQP